VMVVSGSFLYVLFNVVYCVEFSYNNIYELLEILWFYMTCYRQVLTRSVMYYGDKVLGHLVYVLFTSWFTVYWRFFFR
jgi:hypothetical protein